MQNVPYQDGSPSREWICIDGDVWNTKAPLLEKLGYFPITDEEREEVIKNRKVAEYERNWKALERGLNNEG